MNTCLECLDLLLMTDGHLERDGVAVDVCG
jgi:hypothetical protein